MTSTNLKQSIYECLKHIIESTPQLEQKYNEYSTDKDVYIFIKDLLELETDQKVSDLGLEEAVWLLNESIYELSMARAQIVCHTSDVMT